MSADDAALSADRRSARSGAVRGWRAFGAAWRAAGRSLAAEQDRWPLWIPVGLGAGIALYFSLPVEPTPWLGGGAAAAAVVAAGMVRGRPVLLLAAIAVGAVALGLAAATLRTAMVDTAILARDLPGATLVGRVVEAERLASGRRLLLDRPTIEGLAAVDTPRRVRSRVFVDGPDAPRPGDWVRLRASLGPPAPPSAPGLFDFQRQAFFDGLGAVGFSFRVERVEPPGGGAAEGLPWWLRLARARHTLTERVQAALPGPVGAIAAALTTGSRNAIPEDILQAMRDSGLAHLLSISGLHMGFVAGIFFFAVRAGLALIPRLALARPIKKWAALAALGGAFVYLLLSGGSVPTQRSFLMTGLVLVAILVDRSPISLRLVAWAGFVLLLLRPDALVGASFQMSFAAVLCLVAAYEAWRESPWRRRFLDPSPLRRLALALGGSVATSVVATVATAPFAAFHFNRLALYGVAANMIAVPLTGVWVMPWAVVAFLLMPFGLERFGLLPMGWGIEAIVAVADAVAAWPGAAPAVPAMPAASLALVSLGGLWLCLWRRRWRLWGLAGVAAGIALMPLARPPDLMVAQDGKLVAVRDAAGEIHFSPGRGARFDRELWLRRAGQAEERRWPSEGVGGVGGRLACDALGCLYRANGRTVALVWKPDALAEDCAIADLVVSLEPVRGPCGAAHVIDWFDLWREGGHAAWLDGDGLRVLSVADTRGTRPWVARRGKAERTPGR